MKLAKVVSIVTASIMLAACGSGGSESGAKASRSSTGEGATATTAVVKAIADAVPAKFADGVNAAVYSDWAPEEYVEDSKFKGWSVELATLMSQTMGVPFKYHASGFDAIIPGLDNGRYDLAVASLGVTPERLASLDFVPLQKEGTAFAWKKGNEAASVKSIKGVCGMSVAVLTGAWEYDYLTKHNAKICGDNPMKIQQFKDQPSAELAVSSGRVDLVAAGSGKLGYAAKQSGQLEVGDFIVNPVYNGLGVPKGSPLGPILRDALQSLIDNGTYADVRKQWGASEAGNLDKAVLVTEAHPNG